MSAWQRAPLWLRLVTSVLALATVALVINGVVGGRLLRGYLVDRLDDQLQAAARALPNISDISGSPQVPNPFHVSLLDGRGRVVNSYHFPLRAGQTSPDLPALSVAETAERQGEPFTTDATDGGADWRAMALPLADESGTVVVATSLGDVNATVDRLRDINLLVGLVVLVGLGVTGYWTVRSALRPLDEIEQTAAAITAGDLTERVAKADASTEIGRLGQSLNSMLDQIETAFRDREASEATARRSETRMRQFVADASHELRTPLTSIRGFAELYRQGGVADGAALPDLLRRIEDEAARMGLLVDDLLLLARLDEERPLEQARVDLGEVVREAVAAARPIAPDRALEVTDEIDDPIVIGDEPRLRQAVSNLLDNALRHTPQGTAVEVTLRRAEGDGGERVVLEVQDHGPGLTPEQAERVFERFYRTDVARSRGNGGAGLGLSIVAAVVAAHGGTAEVDSAPGAGARFRVLLPLEGLGG